MKLFSILRKDLLILTRNRAEMLVLFLMPLAFILPISIALGKGDGYGINRNNRMIQLPVINYDAGPRAQELMVSMGQSLLLETGFNPALIETLGLAEDEDCAPVSAADPESPAAPSSPACSEKVARELLQRSARAAVLIIPEGISASINAGEQVQVTLLYDPTGDSVRLQQIEGIVKGATLKLSVKNQVTQGIGQLNDLVVLAPQEVRQSIQEQSTQAQEEEKQPAINLKKIAPENAQLNRTPDTYQQTIPGYTIMYVFFIITSMAGSVRQEKNNGTFRRLLSAPVSRAELLGGKMLASLLVGLAQVILLFLVGAVVFRLGLGRDPLAFLLLTIALVASATALGLAASATRIQGASLGAPLVIGALLGGCMFPLDLMPSFLRSLSYFVPHSWALSGYQDLMVRGLGLQEVLPQIGALLGFTLLFFLIATWRFRFED